MKEEEMLKRLKAGEDPLELSIEKWQDIVDGKGKDEGYFNCALCRVDKGGCDKCQIFKKSRQLYCQGTPYEKYSNLTDEIDEREDSISTDKEKRLLLKYAEAELKFLKSLRKSP